MKYVMQITLEAESLVHAMKTATSISKEHEQEKIQILSCIEKTRLSGDENPN